MVRSEQMKTFGWFLSQHGTTSHFVGTDEKMHGRSLCGCKESKRGWRDPKIATLKTTRCRDCDWRFQMVIDSLTTIRK